MLLLAGCIGCVDWLGCVWGWFWVLGWGFCLIGLGLGGCWCLVFGFLGGFDCVCLGYLLLGDFLGFCVLVLIGVCVMFLFVVW